MAANVVHHLADGFQGVAQTFTTAAFTPQANSVIFVRSSGFTGNSNNPTVSWTVTDSEGLSWSPITGLSGSLPFGGGFYNLDWDGFYALVGSSPVSMTITVDKFPGTQSSSYGVSVDSVTGLASPYYVNATSNTVANGSGTLTRTEPTGPTLVSWHAGTDDVDADWDDVLDAGYTRLGESVDASIQSDSWYSASSSATTVTQTWTSTGTEYSTTGFSIELVEAAGTPPNDGTAALGIDLALAAVGAAPSIPPGTGTSSVGVAVALAAVGSAPTIPPSEGTASLGVALELAATGSTPVIPPNTGTAALGIDLALAATGVAPVVGAAEGAAALALQIAIAATGAAPVIPPSTGTSALGVDLALAATGSAPVIPPAEGAAAFGLGVALAAVGSAPVIPPSSGTAALAVGVAVAAVGFAPGGGGFAGFGISISLDAVGSRPSEGTAALAIGLQLAAVGVAPSIPPNEGTAALGVGIGLAATGSAPTIGAAEGAAALGIGLALAAVGSRPSQGTAAFEILVGLRAFAAISGTHPIAVASSAGHSVNVMAAPDGQTILAVSDGDVVRYYEHPGAPGWTAWTGDPGTLIGV